MNNSDIFSFIGCIVGLGFLVLLVFLAIHLVSKRKQERQHPELTYNRIFQQLPQDKQLIFVMQYNSIKKNPTTAVLLALFLGGLGAHKFYMGQVGVGVLYLLFVWTFIPAILVLIDAFVIAGQVAKYNEQKALELFVLLGTGRP